MMALQVVVGDSFHDGAAGGGSSQGGLQSEDAKSGQLR